jgi:hypothetical protein
LFGSSKGGRPSDNSIVERCACYSLSERWIKRGIAGTSEVNNNVGEELPHLSDCTNLFVLEAIMAASWNPAQLSPIRAYHRSFCDLATQPLGIQESNNLHRGIEYM